MRFLFARFNPSKLKCTKFSFAFSRVSHELIGFQDEDEEDEKEEQRYEGAGIDRDLVRPE